MPAQDQLTLVAAPGADAPRLAALGALAGWLSDDVLQRLCLAGQDLADDALTEGDPRASDALGSLLRTAIDNLREVARAIEDAGAGAAAPTAPAGHQVGSIDAG